MDEQPDPVENAARLLAYSLKEMVSETREDVKKLVAWSERVEVRLENGTKRLDDHEVRVRKIESTGMRLSGAWTTIGVLGSVFAGSAGLVIATYSLLQ